MKGDRIIAPMQRSLLATLLALTLLPAPVQSWGYDVHRFITDRAIDLLPQAIRSFYEKHRDFIVERAIDPDLWRTVGFEGEPPRHFLDLDAYGEYPFDALPRDYDEAVAKYGRDYVRQYGVLPWRTAEIYDQLVAAFQQVTDGSPSAADNAKYFSAVLSHYVADAHVPFHAVLNYDGQLTGQHGVHSRWETQLVARYRPQLRLSPGPVRPVTEPRDFIFDALLESFRLTEPVLAADRRATEGRQLYDDGYFEVLFEETRSILERRLSEAIAAVASVIAGAWQQGGSPALPLETPRTIRRIRPSDR
jgi:hypothetical protein